MCGIMGLVTEHDNGFSSKETEVFAQNMFINQLRGNDSTGAFQVHAKEGKIKWIKNIGSPGHLWASEGWKEDFRPAFNRDARVVIGHGRAATRGTVNARNAHPFCVPLPEETPGQLVMVHNGTLDQWQGRWAKPNIRQFEVDSEWLAHCFAEHGSVHTLERVKGPIAAIWYNSHSKTMSFYRNDGRPLHYSITIDSFNKQTIHINSEAEALRWLITRNSLKSIDDEADVFYFEPGILYELPIDNMFGDFKETKIVPVKNPDNEPAASTTVITNEKWEAWARAQDEELTSRFRDRQRQPLQAQNKAALTTPPQRGLHSDLADIADGKYVRVFWDTSSQGIARRHTTHASGAEQTEYQQYPYEPFLVSMVLSATKENTIEKTFHDTQKGTYVVEVPCLLVTRNFGKFRHIDEKKQDSGKEESKPVAPVVMIPTFRNAKFEEIKKTSARVALNGAKMVIDDPKFYQEFYDTKIRKFKPGRKFHFHSKPQILGQRANQVIKHTAKISERGGVLLDAYGNDHDGNFASRDLVLVEIVERTQSEWDGIEKVRALRVRQGFDQAVEFYWYATDQVDKLRFQKSTYWAGDITLMRVSDKVDFEARGNIVSIMLENLTSPDVNLIEDLHKLKPNEAKYNELLKEAAHA